MVSRTDYDPRSEGALCDQCAIKAVLKDKWNPVPTKECHGGGLLLASDYPGETELVEGEPLCGNAGKVAAERLKEVRDRTTGARKPVFPGEYAKTNAILCEIPGGKLPVLKAAIGKSNRKRKKTGRPLLRMPEECCRPRLMNDIRRHPNVVAAGNVIIQAILQTKRTITALRGGPILARLNSDDSVDTLTEEEWAQLNDAAVGRRDPSRRRVGGVELLDHPGRVPGPNPDAPLSQLVRILPTFNPALVFHQKRHTITLQADIDKATRWFREGALRWERPDVTYTPSPAELRAFLQNPAQLKLPDGSTVPFISFDLETTREDPLYARINCIGFGTLTHAVVIPLASIHDPKATQAQMVAGGLQHFNGGLPRTSFYSEEDEAEILRICQEALENPKLLKVGWNSRAFDRTVIKARWGTDIRWHVDLIIAHKLFASELPHGLGYAASIDLDLGAWKADHTGTEATTDADLHVYNGVDDVVTARLAPILLPRVAARGQWHLLAPDMKTQDLAAGIHENGVLIDQRERRRLERMYRHEAAHFRALCCEIAGYDFNPGSYPQLADLIYTKWGLSEIDFTEMGAAKVDDAVMRAHFLDGAIPAPKRVLFDAVRRYRRAMKYLGTYIVKLRPNIELVEGEWALWDEEIEDEELRQEIASEAWIPGKVGPDGRYHYDIKAHVAVTGRLASAIQSMPRRLRSMVVPGVGRVYVYADMDQLELRLASVVWNAKAYLEVFRSKQDAHALTAAMLYGEEWARAVKGSEDWERMRDFAKRFAYAVLYGAEDQTVYDVIVAVENDAGELIYAGMPMRETKKRRKAWLDANPEIETGWEHEVKEYRQQGFLRDPIVGRRRDFLDGENFNELVNFKIQAGGSAIVRKGCFELMRRRPHQYAGHGTGFVGEFHDAVLLEVPESEAEAAQRDVHESMNREEMGMMFSAKAKILRRFADPHVIKAAA